jgi:hypothetical protein
VFTYGEYRLPHSGCDYNFMTCRPKLLRVAPTCSEADESGGPNVETTSTDASPAKAHRDERQIQLDTERSFVLYPAGERLYDVHSSYILLCLI